MKHWYLRLLENGLAREGEGVGTGEGAPAKRGNSHEADDEEDEDEPNDPDAAKSVKEWRAYSRRLRTESANRRLENKTLKQQLSEANQKLADAEKAHVAALAKKDADHKTASDALVVAAVKEVNDKHKGGLVTAELRAAAKVVGAKDIDDLLKIVDASAITIDDKGAVVGVSELIEATKKAKPHLFGAASTTTSSTATAPAATQVDGKDALKMTPEEFNSSLASMGIRL